VVVRDGAVTHRPGLDALVAENLDTRLEDSFRGRDLRYFDGEVDYALMTGDSGRVGLWHYDEDYQPDALGDAMIDPAFGDARGPIGRWGMDAYVCSELGPYRFLDALGNRELVRAGLEPFDADVGAMTAAVGSAGNLTGDVTIYASRYNALLGIESNAVEIDTLTVTADQIDIDIANPHDYTTRATHARIYAARADGYGFAGLIAEVELPHPDSGSDFAYSLGDSAVGNEQNGGSTYDPADDDTNINYAPPTQNGLPPTNATCFLYHQSRGFWGTEDGRIWFSQSVDELQGHVEHVAALSYRTVPRNERIVAMAVLYDSIYIWTDRQIYRLSGQVNSVTNLQRNLGTLDDEIVSTDIIEPVEGTVGCVSPQSVVAANTPKGERIAFAGPEHAYIFDGAAAVPITDGLIQSDYNRLRALARSGIISGAHHKADNLIVFSFAGAAILAYDYVTGQWVRWFEGALFPVGPVSTRAINRIEADDMVALVGDIRTVGGNLQVMDNPPYALRFADQDEVEDLLWFNNEQMQLVTRAGLRFAPTWLGPDLIMGRPDRLKRFGYLQAYFDTHPNDATGKVKAYAYLNGQNSGDPIPNPAPQWGQNAVHSQNIVQRLGVRGLSIQPKFELSAQDGAERSGLLGYGFEYGIVGRR
jgi:hypothetical protein